MAKIPRRVSYVKLVNEARKTKKTISVSKRNDYAKWQERFGKKAKDLDTLDGHLRKGMKSLEALIKAREERREALKRYLKIVLDAHKELEVFKNVPVPGTFPLPSVKNVTGAASLMVVLVATISAVHLIKVFMAKCEAEGKA